MRLAICDDEETAREELRDLVLTYMARHDLQGKVTTFDNGRTLLEYDDWDIIFLDIKMPGLDGMEAARRLRDMQSCSRLIFITALKEYVFDAFSVEASDYLLKPVSYDKMAQTLDRLLRPRMEKHLQVRVGNSFEIVPFKDIEYCEIQGRKLRLRLTGGRELSYNGRIRELEQALNRDFFRCHRSYIVNLRRVASCGHEEVRTSGGERVPVSRLREKDLKEALLRFLSGND